VPIDSVLDQCSAASAQAGLPFAASAAPDGAGLWAHEVPIVAIAAQKPIA
jgi:hypothetical protein